MKHLYVVVSVIVFGVIVAYFSPLAKMEGRTCIVGGTLTRAVIDPSFCPDAPKGDVVLSAKYVSTLTEPIFYHVDGCAARTPGACAVNDEFQVCSGLIEAKAGEPFEVNCNFYLAKEYTGYFIVSVFYNNTSVNPVENFPTVTLLHKRKTFMPFIIGGKK